MNHVLICGASTRAAAESAARAGGRELMAWRGRFNAREKGVADYVTDAVLKSAKTLRWEKVKKVK